MRRRGCFASIWLLQMSLTTMRLKYGSQYDLIWQQAGANEPLTGFKVQDYERLEQELVAAKEAGRSYEDLESTTDALLPILHDIVSDIKALDSYYKAKQYEKIIMHLVNLHWLSFSVIRSI